MKKLIILSCSIIVGSVCGACSATEDVTPTVTDTFSNMWKFHAGEGVDSLWTTVAYNDAAWQEVTTDNFLQEQIAVRSTGFGWYRKVISLSDSLQSAVRKKGAVMLHLGRLVSADEVYVNGTLVGKTGGFPHDYKGYNESERHYLVPADVLNIDGANLIAVKFFDWNTGGFLKEAKLTVASAETNDKLALNITVADPDYIFLAPDDLRISATLDNKNAWSVNGNLIATLTTDDYQFIQSDTVAVRANAATGYTYSFSRKEPAPGFYRYTVTFEHNGTTAVEKKFNVGFEPEKINSPVDAKADFKTFWDNNLRELAKVAPQYKLTPQPQYANADYNVFLVEMRSFGNELIRGYYAQPTREGKHPVIVEYMGYGSAPYVPNTQWDGFAYFVLSIRGQGLNQPTNRFGAWWITYGLENKENYYYRGAFLDVVRALDFVSSRPEIAADKIAVRGGSQGGALSFVAAALDRRVKVAAPTIPFLSDYRDYFKITHWPKADFDLYVTKLKLYPEAQWEKIYDILTYFDIKNLAPWIECPVIMGIGVQDEVCPPHTNFAAYNQVRSEKQWMAFPEFAHSVGAAYNDAAKAFIKEKLNIQ
jgi:cephalosporin-C deacetylase-like acetyl esterase